MSRPQLALRVAVTSPALPARRAPGLTFTVRSAADLPPVLDGLAGRMEALGYPERDRFGMRLALEEALVNALKHGHNNDPAKEVRLRCRVSAERVVAEVEDQGPGFDPAAVPDPLAPHNLAKPSGRGLLLMRHYLSWLHHNPRGNVATLCKRRSPA